MSRIQSVRASNTSDAHLAFYTAPSSGGITERMRIDSSGNVGIGVTPSSGVRLDVRSNAAATIGDFRNASATGFGLYVAAGDTSSQYAFRAADYQNNALFSVMGDGNVGIGTSSPATTLNVKSSSYPYVRVTNDGYTGLDIGQADSGESGAGLIKLRDSAPLLFYTADLERMRIDSSGNLMVGKTAVNFTTVGAELRSNGQINSGSTADFLNMFSTSASAYRFYVTNAGTIKATSTTISAISDQRFKENIRDLDDGLSKVMELRPRKFDWKEGKGADIKDDRGFIAQEFEEVFPDLVGEWKDEAPEGEEPYKAVSQDLIPTLVKAIQEQQTLIESLTARIAALEE